MVKIHKNFDFGLNVRKCSVQIFGNLDNGKNFRKILLLAKISKILNFQIFGNSIFFFFYMIPNLVKIMVNPDFFFWNWRKITIFLKFYEKSQICLKFPEKFRDFRFFKKKISMFVKIFETVDFGQKFEKNRFWSKFSKISICIKLIEIWFLSKIFENHDFSQDFQKSCLITKFVKNLSFDKKIFFRKIWIFFSKFWKILTWLKIYENLDFGKKNRKRRILSQFPKISILVKIFEYSQFFFQFTIQFIIDEIISILINFV